MNIKYSFSFISILLISCACIAQCPVPNPSGTGNCSYSSAELNLTSSGSTGYYNWYAASTGGLPVASGNTYQTPLINSTTTYYVAATDTNTSLLFDGNDDYIAIDTLTYSGTGYTELTVEAWINTSTGTNQDIVSFDRSEFWRFEIAGSGAGTGQVGFDINTSSGILDFGSVSRVDDGNWHHIAGVFDNGTVSIYIDGILDATTTTGATFGSSLLRYGFLGTGSEASSYNGTSGPTDYFDGKMDEVRIWNIARTQTELNSFKDTCLTGNETGLLAYYNMNEFTGNTISDVTGGGANGTLNNFTLASAWVQGTLMSCACESSRVPVVAEIGGGTNLTDEKLTCGAGVSLDAGAGYTTYSWSTGDTTQILNTNQSGIYTVSVTGGICPGSDTISVVGYTHSKNALDFDGVNDYVAINNMTYQGTNYTELSIETWVKSTNSGDQIIASFDRSEYWRLEINGDGGGVGQIGFDLMTSSGQLDFGSVSRVDDGSWHHVAVVFDNGAVSIYIDGVLDATTTTGTTFGSGALRYGFLGTGSEASSFNGSTGPNNRFIGEIDEFRIWSKARTQTEIRGDMAKHIAGNETDLDIYYKFDETSGNLINDYSTMRIENATMYNFSAAARVVSGVSVGDESVLLYPGSWSGQTLSINSCDGETFSLSTMTGTPTGVHLYYIHAVPNDVTGIVGLGTNDRYFGVYKVNDIAATYTATYNYTGNPHVNSTSEPTVALFKRSDNSSSPWVNTAATLDTTANTLIATAQSTEFILGSTGTPLPIELINFDANINDNKVDLKWVTVSELNNDFFTVQKSKDGRNWQEVIEMRGAGNSNQQISYFDSDYMPFVGQSYYRLKQTDYDGNYTYSNIVPVYYDSEAIGSLSLYPNPIDAGDELSLSFNEIEEEEILVVLRDITGKEYYSKLYLGIEKGMLIGLPIEKVIPAGLYLITATSENSIYSKKLVIR